MIQFMLLVAMLLAGMDTPALAFDNAQAASIDGHHHAFVEVLDDAIPDKHSPADGGSELLHHHCPASLAADEFAGPAVLIAVRDIHLARAATALSSRATAPPTEPPAA